MRTLPIVLIGLTLGCPTPQDPILPDTGEKAPPDCEDTAPEPQDSDPCAGGAGELTLSAETVSFDWWEGQDLPVSEIEVEADDPDCAEIVVQASQPWVDATLADGILSVTIAFDQLVSGKHSAQVALWDAKTDAVAAEVEVNASVLMRPATEYSRNVLVVGVDGLDGEEMLSIDAPVMESLMQRGLWSYSAVTQLTGATSSGPGWTSILTGVETTVHGITSNGGYDGRNTDYPSFLYRAKHELGLGTAATIQWSDIWEILEDDVADGTGDGSMQEVAATMAGLLRSGLHNVHFVALDDVDGAGHSVGYLASEQVYYDTVVLADSLIGELVDAILERPGIENEHWLVIVTSDHGGDAGGSHGTMSDDYQTIPLIIAAPGLLSTRLHDGAGSHLDVHPTAIEFLGLDASDYGLSGGSWWEREADCSDGVDNDGDGLTDCDDTDCDGDVACIECPATDLGSAIGDEVVPDVPFDQELMTGSCGGAGAESTYGWVAPDDGRYSFDTVGAYRDTVLYALDGDCTGAELACSEDIPGLGSGRSAFAIDLTAGQEIVVVVDSFNTSQTNPSELSIYPFTSSCPDGDLGTGTGSWTGTHTHFDQAHTGSCPPAVGNLELTWTAPADGTYTYSTVGSGFDTVAYVLDSCGGTELTCNDDASGYQSIVSFDATEGQEIIIGIGGFHQSQGDYVISIE